MTTWKESKTVNGTVIRYRELAADAHHDIGPGGEQWVKTFHPYDMARYHYAHSENGRDWAIYREAPMPYAGSRYRGPEYKGAARDCTPEQVLERLRELDKSVTAHIDLS